MKTFVFTNRVSMLLLFVMLLAFMNSVYGFECQLGGSSETILDKINPINPKSCPTFLDSSDKKFCCREPNTGLSICCDFQDFVGNENVIWMCAGIVAVLLITMCICCCCCPCCCVYKRRNGVVYGRVIQPGTVTVHHVTHEAPAPAYPVQPMIQPMVQAMTQPIGYYQAMDGTYAAYPAHGMQQPPPPYSNVSAPHTNDVGLYTKQAPYNPNYQ